MPAVCLLEGIGDLADRRLRPGRAHRERQQFADSASWLALGESGRRERALDRRRVAVGAESIQPLDLLPSGPRGCPP